MTKKTIGIFGSAFNPPSKGHFNSINQVLEQFDEVWLVPSFLHAFDKNMVSYHKRVLMTKLFVNNFNNEKIKVSNIEEIIYNESSSSLKYIYTYDVLTFLSKKYIDYKFVFICGEDNSEEKTWSKFYKNKEIDQEFGKIITKEIVNIRSTYIRECFLEKKFDNLNQLTFDNIIDFIKQEKLY